MDIPTLMANATRIFVALPPAIMKLGTIFDEVREELILAGGSVRDMFLGMTPHGFDMTTSTRPEHTEELLAQRGNTTWDTGKEFDTIDERHGDLVVEATTYRIDGYKIGSRKPEVTFGDTLEGDLTCCNFTVNAMAMHLLQMAFVNLCGGLADSADGNLRTPVSAEQPLDDNLLRTMRVAHFSAQLGFNVDMDVMNTMETMASRLETVSAERIHAELGHFIISPYPRRDIKLMVHTGIADIVLSEVAGPISTTDEYKRHKDVYEHTLTAIEQTMDLRTGPDGAAPAPGFILRFVVFIYGVGKPATRRFESNGIVSFHHHEIAGAKMTRKRMKTLYFDKVTIEAIPNLAALHLRFRGYGKAAWSDPAVHRYITDAGDLLERLRRLMRANCTTHNRRKANYLFTAYGDLGTHIAALCEQGELGTIHPDLDGGQIIEILGLRPSRAVKIARDYLFEPCMKRGPPGEEAARQVLLDWWALNDIRTLTEEYQAQQTHWETKVAEKKARKAIVRAARKTQGQ